MISAELARHAANIELCRVGKPIAVAGLPVAMVTTANRRENRWAKAKRMKDLRGAAFLRTKSLMRAHALTLPLVVRIVRVAPRQHGTMDRDNLENAAKPLRDGIADAFKVDDNDPLIGFVCDQETPEEPFKKPFTVFEVYRP